MTHTHAKSLAILVSGAHRNGPLVSLYGYSLLPSRDQGLLPSACCNFCRKLRSYGVYARSYLKCICSSVCILHQGTESRYSLQIYIFFNYVWGLGEVIRDKLSKRLTDALLSSYIFTNCSFRASDRR